MESGSVSEAINTGPSGAAGPKQDGDQVTPNTEHPGRPASKADRNGHDGGRAEEARATGHIVIKKYANRRLYNTYSSSYVTLEHLSDLVKAGTDFVVFDAKTNEDITRQVLTQIIFEAENTDQNLLPIQFLRQLIQLYGNQMQSLVPGYLEMSLDAFARQQDKMREQMGGAFAQAPGYRLFEEQVRQNMSLFSQAMKMFAPFGYPSPDDLGAWAQGHGTAAKPSAPAPAAAPTPAPAADSLADLKTRIEEMQRQIERLAKG
jgi:polyhydroxyalkanoate synthesis repressor PhaR